MDTPCFSSWSNEFQHHARQFRQLTQGFLHQLQLLGATWIPAQRFAQADDGTFSGIRKWPLKPIFWTFFWQTAQAGASCGDAVRQARAICTSQAQPLPADQSGLYCTARSKLTLGGLDSVHRDLVQNAQAQILEGNLWSGYRTLALDGPCFTMADTPENQAVYPQPSVQKPGCGFPLARLLAFFRLRTGLIRDWITDNWHQHELGLLPRLLEVVRRGELLLADRGFGNFCGAGPVH